MRDFVKIYSTILDSSVWGESKDVKLLWVTILAMGGETGVVEASVGGLARRAGLTREECEVALGVLLSPDPDDKSGVDEGRRIRKTERGWSITNHRLYRDFRTDKQIETAERVQKHRTKTKTVTRVTGNDVTAGNTESRPVRPDREREEDLEQEENPPPKDLPGRGGELPSVVVVPRSAEGGKVPCPADLQLDAAQRGSLVMDSGMTDHQVNEYVRMFRAANVSNRDHRTLDAWRRSLVTFACNKFRTAHSRPPRSADEAAGETDSQTRLRLRNGPRQPNASDHSDPEQHLAAIGATVV